MSTGLSARPLPAPWPLDGRRGRAIIAPFPPARPAMTFPRLKTVPLKRRRTKIVATVGPASSEPAVLEALIRCGVNVFRLNLSHGDQAGHRAAYDRVRAAAAAADEPVA